MPELLSVCLFQIHFTIKVKIMCPNANVSRSPKTIKKYILPNTQIGRDFKDAKAKIDRLLGVVEKQKHLSFQHHN